MISNSATFLSPSLFILWLMTLVGRVSSSLRLTVTCPFGPPVVSRLVSSSSHRVCLLFTRGWTNIPLPFAPALIYRLCVFFLVIWIDTTQLNPRPSSAIQSGKCHQTLNLFIAWHFRVRITPSTHHRSLPFPFHASFAVVCFCFLQLLHQHQPNPHPPPINYPERIIRPLGSSGKVKEGPSPLFHSESNALSGNFKHLLTFPVLMNLNLPVQTTLTC